MPDILIFGIILILNVLAVRYLFLRLPPKWQFLIQIVGLIGIALIIILSYYSRKNGTP